MWEKQDNTKHKYVIQNRWAQSLFGKNFFDLNRKDSRAVKRKINGKKDVFKL